MSRRIEDFAYCFEPHCILESFSLSSLRANGSVQGLDLRGYFGKSLCQLWDIERPAWGLP